MNWHCSYIFICKGVFALILLNLVTTICIYYISSAASSHLMVKYGLKDSPSGLMERFAVEIHAENILTYAFSLDAFSNVTNMSSDLVNRRLMQVSKIGILIPTTTRKLKGMSLVKFSLIKECIPSILRTITRGYFYKIFIGMDTNDKFMNNLKNNFERRSGKASVQSIQLVSVKSDNFVSTVNVIAQEAVHQGMNYLVRINDDTVFTTKDWTPLAIHALNNYDPPNIGVVGPKCKDGNTEIMTHDFVHRTHYEIFKYYYPPQLKNWWSDDWMTHVYEPSRSTRLESWTVQHLLSQMRYSVNLTLEEHLPKLILKDNEKMMSYVFAIRKNSIDLSKGK